MDMNSLSKNLFLVSMEIKEFFLHRRSLHFVPLILFGIFLTVWVYKVAPTFIPLVIVVFGGLEPQYNNVFFRSPRELEALTVLSVDWHRMIVLKNIATLFLTVIAFIAVTATLFYFTPDVYLARSLADAFLFISTVVFPMLHIGNIHSVRKPRRDVGWQVSDLVELLSTVATLAVASIPFWVFVVLFETPGLCIFYGIGSVVYWYKVSVPRTARDIIDMRLQICSEM